MLKDKIENLKKEKDVVILAHNYQIPEVQDVADFVGDSLGLARQAAKTPHKTILFCGVHFMAETAAIISPEKKVLIPDVAAGCSLSDSITLDQLKKWKQEHPNAIAVGYVNTTAEIKSELEERIVEIDAEVKSVKVMLFDAKVQSKSNEISQETFDLVKKETDEMLQHMKHEKSEIAKVKSKLANLSLEDMIPTEPESHPIQDSAVSYLSGNNQQVSAQTHLPEPPSETKQDTNIPRPPMVIPPENEKNESKPSSEPEPEWLKRMRSD